MTTTSDKSSRENCKLTPNVAKRAPIFTCAALTIAALAGLFSATQAQAFSCGRSAIGAGCVSPRGGVAFNRNGAVAVGRYGNVYAYRRGSTCYWRNNQRICP